nr:MAG TPA: Wyosine base formation [Caudoviricetes sp.]
MHKSPTFFEHLGNGMFFLCHNFPNFIEVKGNMWYSIKKKQWGYLWISKF